ncbi:GNAT family N-acetyltransferase [Phaeobacter sp. NW0010-22]|uniref:GNAT family N-acetyltransferase n=1 Tax=Phaeobacter sp. NW0010-22 TaxID=3135907 RepID=UPI00310439B1
MIRSIPMINTARLTLCAMRPEDFDRFSEIWASPDVVRHIGGQPRTRGESWDAFLRNAGHWQMTGFGQWAIVQQSTRQMIGQAGFFFTNRELGEDFDSFPEAGWIVSAMAQGQGLGYEAARAAHDWFDRIMPGPLVAIIDEDNVSSFRVAEKLGYDVLRQAEFKGTPVQLMRRNGPPNKV